MKPKRIILVRHGQSEGNADRFSYETIPDYALNITELGIEQSLQAGREIAELIRTESVRAYVSPYFRTRETYKLIRSIIPNNIVGDTEDPRIREIDWGHLRHPNENDPIIRERDHFGTFYYRIKDGESGADVYDRVSTFLESMHRDFDREDYPDNSLIVTHGMTLRIFLMRWFYWPVEKFENLRNPDNCQVVVMEMQDNGKYELITPLATYE